MDYRLTIQEILEVANKSYFMQRDKIIYQREFRALRYNGEDIFKCSIYRNRELVFERKFLEGSIDRSVYKNLDIEQNLWKDIYEDIILLGLESVYRNKKKLIEREKHERVVNSLFPLTPDQAFKERPYTYCTKCLECNVIHALEESTGKSVDYCYTCKEAVETKTVTKEQYEDVLRNKELNK